MQKTRKLIKIIQSTSGHRLYSRTTTHYIDRNLKQVTTKHQTSFPDDPYGNYISTYLIDNVDVEEIFNQIEEMTNDWKTNYMNFHILDGCSWNLSLYYSNGEVKHCQGNVEPSNYKDVIDLFYKMIDLDKQESNKVKIK